MVQFILVYNFFPMSTEKYKQQFMLALIDLQYC